VSATGIRIGMTNYLHSFDKATSPRTFLKNETSSGELPPESWESCESWLPGTATPTYGGVLLVEFHWSVKYFIADINLVYARKE